MQLVRSASRPLRRIGITCALIVCALHGRAQLSGANKEHRFRAYQTGAPARAEIDNAINLASGYLVEACGPDGMFAYRINTRTGEPSRSYNIVRHAGAVYALGVFNEHKHDPRVVDAMVRAADFMRHYFVGPGPQPNQTVVWSRPFPEPSVADLGASGLGLVALAAVEKARPHTIPLEEMQGLARFILFLQRPDGSFVSKYRPESGPDEEFESLYYPGEAALGLICLYEMDHSSVWLHAAARALSYLAQSRAHLTQIPPDHWAMIATARLWPYLRQADPGGTLALREVLIHHAEQVCGALMAGQIRDTENPAIKGSFDTRGRTAPTATRLEGLLAAQRFVQDAALNTKIHETVDVGTIFLLHAQIQSGALSGGVPSQVLSNEAQDTTIRIDFVQHALCAWIMSIRR